MRGRRGAERDAVAAERGRRGPRLGRRGVGFEGGLDAFGGVPEDFEAGVTLVVGGDEVAGGEGVVGEHEHSADGGLVGGASLHGEEFRRICEGGRKQGT